MVLLTAIVLAVAAAVFRFKLASSLHLYLEAGASLTIGLLLIFVVARAVFAPGRVTYHRVNGAVLLYLTIGLTFVALFTFVDLLTQHAFSGLSVADIVPVHPFARSLCNLEGIIGQLYPATLLARLVTLELQDRRR
jgi:hypothetical protein